VCSGSAGGSRSRTSRSSAPQPEGIAASVEALVGCIASAATANEHRRHAEAAGHADLTLRPKPEYVAALESFQDPLYRESRNDSYAYTVISYEVSQGVPTC